jgi:transmembrane sensor
VRLDGSDDPALLEECLRWCAQDPRNAQALTRVRAVWDGFGPPRAHASPAPQAGRSAARAGLLALAAGIVLAVASWLAAASFVTQTLDAAAGAPRHARLPDGSQVDLAPDARMSLHFSPLRRQIRLERGQAYFTVAPDLRPFVVKTDGLTATAVATAFDVRTGLGGTVVAVSEGRVTVGLAGLEGGHPVYVRAGQEVSFSSATRHLAVSALAPRVAGSWRTGLLQFVGEPLPQVVAEVNRYVSPGIVLTPAGGHLRFTGTVAPDHVGEFTEALRQIYSVDVLQEDAHAVRIESRAYPR